MPDQMLTVTHARADKILYSKVFTFTHSIGRLKTVSS